jgi:hypothetical protein
MTSVSDGDFDDLDEADLDEADLDEAGLDADGDDDGAIRPPTSVDRGEALDDGADDVLSDPTGGFAVLDDAAAAEVVDREYDDEDDLRGYEPTPTSLAASAADDDDLLDAGSDGRGEDDAGTAATSSTTRRSRTRSASSPRPQRPSSSTARRWPKGPPTRRCSRRTSAAMRCCVRTREAPDAVSAVGSVGADAYRGRMHESAAELHDLQVLLDTSLARATAHLRSIVSAERTLSAEQLTGVLTGMCTLAVSTVTAGGEPRISGADGHFLHGRWVFGTARTAAKARHLGARPAVSVAHMRGEELGVFTHGTAEILNPAAGTPAADWPELLAYFQDFYGTDAFDWEKDVVYFRVDPHWMTVYASDVAGLVGQ